jgi:hypothetical protein
MEQLSARETGLGTTVDTQISAGKTTSVSTIRDGSKDGLYPHSHFTEDLVGAFRKSSQESNFNYKTLSFLIRQLKNNTGFTLQQTTTTRAKIIGSSEGLAHWERRLQQPGTKPHA